MTCVLGLISSHSLNALNGALSFLPAPHQFVRWLTSALAIYWTLRGWQRWLRGIRDLDREAAALGLSHGLVLRIAWIVLLRSTLLDPINLALCCAVLGLLIGVRG